MRPSRRRRRLPTIAPGTQSAPVADRPGEQRIGMALARVALRSPLWPASPLQCRGGIPCSAEGVGFAVQAGFAAFVHQAGGGFLDTPSPVERKQTGGDIRTADIWPAAAASQRRVVHATLIDRPPPRPAVPMRNADYCRRGSLRWCHDAKGLELTTRHHQAGPSVARLDERKRGRGFLLEVQATANSRCS
jgi:hypothetical protein